MADFQAIALTYVGNYTGPCLIQLNGEAILVRHLSGVVINKWPYNCIRQFRAEDVTGKFSFVSGRRGPYGVAEYNFSLPNDSLGTLQNALTNFTGAQFSSVAPGSGAEQQQQLQQQLQQQQPLPPYHPSRQAYSVSNAYQTSTPHVIGGGGGGVRNDSVSSSASYADSVFSSPVHSQQVPIPTPSASSSSPSTCSQVPRLPPRDYSVTSLPGIPSGPSEQTGPFSNSMDEAMLKSQSKGRSIMSASAASTLSSTSLDAGGHSMTPPTLPPRRASHERSPETWVAQSTSYEEVNLQSQQSAKGNRLSKSGSLDSGVTAPPVPHKKKFFVRLRAATGTATVLGSEIVEAVETETGNDHPAVNSYNSVESESSLDVIHMTRSQAEKDKANESSKESPYDHLPSEKEEMAENVAQNNKTELTDSRPGSISPEVLPSLSNGKRSPYYDEEELDLPRSSPTVKVRCITPEQAQKIRLRAEMGEVLHGRSLTTSHANSEGRTSPKAVGKQLKKSQTMKQMTAKSKLYINRDDIHDTYQVPRRLDSNDTTKELEGKEEVESVYNIPRPSSATDLNKVQKTVLDSPPNGKRVGRISLDDASLYNVPRAMEPRPNGDGLHKEETKMEEGVYKVPSSIRSQEASGDSSSGGVHNPQDTYNVPRAVMRDSETDGVYQNLQRNGEGTGSRDATYDTPRHTKTHQSTNPPKFTRSPSARDNYESIDDDRNFGRELPPNPGRMRPARSFESLHKMRVNTTLASDYSTVEERAGLISPPIGRGMYVDIDLERGLAPAKKAPLPPLPMGAAAPLPPPSKVVSEGVYCEISETVIGRNRVLRKTSLATDDASLSYAAHKYTPIHKPRAMTMAQYNEVPPSTRPKLPDPSTSAMQGLAKAKELAEEEGYEFFKPAAQHLSQVQHQPGGNHGAWTTQPINIESSRMIQSTSAGSLLEKYNTSEDSSQRSRPHSDSDQQKFNGPNPAVLGTSTPLDSGPLSDEYVIITGPDRRVKIGSNPPISAGVGTTKAAEDEYEVMTSARAELIHQRIHQQTHYSTPNPSLYSNPMPNPTAPASTSTQIGQSNSDGYSHPLPPRMPDTEEGIPAGVNIDDMSPSDPDKPPIYFNVSHQRKSSSLSVSSGHSEINEEGDGERLGNISGASEGVAITGRPVLVKTMEGSPMDISDSIQLKNQTRSLGNVLEEVQIPSPSHSHSHTSSPHNSRSVSSTSLSFHTTTSTTSSSNRRHNYINHVPNLGEEDSNPSAPDRSSPTLKNKRPRPLPRSPFLRGESLTSEANLSS